MKKISRRSFLTATGILTASAALTACSGGRHFPCAGGSCGAVMGGDADSSGAGDDLVK